jgi:lambda family phage portal protein
MWSRLASFLGLARRRGFDAAGGGRRWEGAKGIEALNASILAGATTAARRAGWYARNNPWVASAVQGLVANAIGAGVKPRSKHPDPAVRERLHALWRRWTDCADASGLTDFYGLQALALRAMIESGENFARLRFVDADNGVRLAIDLLDREQVPTDLHREISAGARIRAGIEFDALGRRVAYHCYRNRPSDALAPMSMDLVRVPAADMLHFFQPLAAGQLRGITWLAPILLRPNSTNTRTRRW